MLKWAAIGILVLNLLVAASMVLAPLLGGPRAIGVQPEFHAERIQVYQPSTTSAVAAVSAPTATPQPEPIHCGQWGDFSGDDLAKVKKALEVMQLGVHLQSEVIEYTKGYWVYIGPLKNRVEVDRKIAQLKLRGINDFFIVPEAGEFFIQLGIFKSEAAAKAHLAELATLKVKSAVVGERQTHLKLTRFKFKELDEASWARVQVLQRAYPESELQSLECQLGAPQSAVAASSPRA